MAYTTPNTSWLAGDPVLASDMNRIEGNIVALKDPPASEYELNEASDYTTSSSTFVDVDATNLSLTITTTGGDVLIGFSGATNHSAGGAVINFAVDIDGTTTPADDGLIVYRADDIYATAFTYIATGLSAGSHTFKLQWRTSAATATLYAGSNSGASVDVHPQFFVREI